MHIEVNFSDFYNAFIRMDRKNDFSYEGLRVLFDYLEGYEEDIGERIELDVIGFCCDYNEYSLEDINREYIKEFGTMNEAREWLEYKTSVCGVTDDTIVFAAF